LRTSVIYVFRDSEWKCTNNQVSNVFYHYTSYMTQLMNVSGPDLFNAQCT